MAAPTVTSISPSFGVLAGGYTVDIVGTGFSVSAPTVKFDQTAATSVVVLTDLHLTCVVTATSAVHSVHVTVTTTDGTSQVNDASLFYYVSAVPQPTYDTYNPFFDPLANYTFYGEVKFARGVASSGGGGGGGGSGLTWVSNSTTSITMAAGTGYITTNAGAIAATLPGGAAVGDVFGIARSGAGNFTITTPGGSLFRLASSQGTSVASTQLGDTLQIVCVAAPAPGVVSFMAISATGSTFSVT